MQFQSLAFTTVVVGVVSGASASFTSKVTVPFMTNAKNIAEGVELVVEGRATPAKGPAKALTWRDSVAPPKRKVVDASDAITKAVAATKPKGPPPKGAPVVKAVKL